MSEKATCALCEIEGHDADVRLSLVRWVEPIGDEWEAVDRCRDRIACRIRVETPGPDGSGRAWPVIDTQRDREAWETRDDAPPPPPPPAERPAVAPKPPADGAVEAEPELPETWSPPFVDEPEEEQSWV
jgi:hypothetical protein